MKKQNHIIVRKNRRINKHLHIYELNRAKSVLNNLAHDNICDRMNILLRLLSSSQTSIQCQTLSLLGVYEQIDVQKSTRSIDVQNISLFLYFVCVCLIHIVYRDMAVCKHANCLSMKWRVSLCTNFDRIWKLCKIIGLVIRLQSSIVICIFQHILRNQLVNWVVVFFVPSDWRLTLVSCKMSKANHNHTTSQYRGIYWNSPTTPIPNESNTAKKNFCTIYSSACRRFDLIF